MRIPKACFLVLIVFFFPSFSRSQDAGKLKAKFSTLAIFTEPEIKFRGYLVESKESELVFSTSPKVDLPFPSYAVERFHVSQIHTLKFRQRSAPVIGGAIGFVAGLGVGVLIASSTEPKSDGGFAGAYAAVGEAAADLFFTIPLSALAGATIGALLGSKRKAFVIEGQAGKYRQYRPQLQRYEMHKK